MNTAYYNEHDPFAASWLEELIKGGHIMDGVVDRRSIEDVLPSELTGFTRCHFFAGIGGWDYALQLAGWPDDRQIWTGSCPCQPFSAAGQGGGFADERHLWPSWFWLIQQCRPPVLVGEQVEAAIRHGWLDLVQDDLEGEGYAVGAVGLPAACVGAPHIRQRLWFVAESEGTERQRGGTSWGRRDGLTDGGVGELADPLPAGRPERRSRTRGGSVAGGSGADGMGDSQGGHGEVLLQQRRPQQGRVKSGRAGRTHELGHPDHTGPQGHGRSLTVDDAAGREGTERHDPATGVRSGGVAQPDGGQSSDRDLQRSWEHLQRTEDGGTGFWSDLIWLPCRDGKARPTQPGLQPLAHGVPNRVGTLRGAGNAIVPQVGAEVIKAYMSVRG